MDHYVINLANFDGLHQLLVAGTGNVGASGLVSEDLEVRKRLTEIALSVVLGAIELTVPTTGGTEIGTEPPVPDLLERLEDVTLDPSAYEGRIGQFQSIVDRTLRDPDRVRELRALYGDRCQVCGSRSAAADGTGYSEVHNLKPLGEPHRGPDSTANALVVCPTHHAALDNGVLQIDPEEWTVTHPYDPDQDGTTLTFEDDHVLDPDVVAFHNETICAQRQAGP